MNIIEKMQQKEQAFDQVKKVIADLEAQIDEYKDEMKRLQGEYRLLVEIGQEEGILDENGQLIVEEPAETN